MVAYCNPLGPSRDYTGEFNSTSTSVSLKDGGDLHCLIVQDCLWFLGWRNGGGNLQ